MLIWHPVRLTWQATLLTWHPTPFLNWKRLQLCSWMHCCWQAAVVATVLSVFAGESLHRVSLRRPPQVYSQHFFFFSGSPARAAVAAERDPLEHFSLQAGVHELATWRGAGSEADFAASNTQVYLCTTFYFSAALQSSSSKSCGALSGWIRPHASQLFLTGLAA